MTEKEDSSNDQTMAELFISELEVQIAVMNAGLLALEKGEDREGNLKSLMRAAHSIKGAARIVHLDPVVRLAHAMEEIFVGIRESTILSDENLIDSLLSCVDLLVGLLKVPTLSPVSVAEQQKNSWDKAFARLAKAISLQGQFVKPGNSDAESVLQEIVKKPKRVFDRILRISATHLNRLMGLAGETLLEARVIEPIYHRLTLMKGKLGRCIEVLNALRDLLVVHPANGRDKQYIKELHEDLEIAKVQLADRVTELDRFIVRHVNLSDRLYHEVLDSRMRPFNDGVEGFPRMMRDLAKELNKVIQFEILGRDVPVDREILEKLESPLSHLLRNALDHGIESPEIRRAVHKPENGKITLEAQHLAGMLVITVSDDGSGIDLEKLRRWIVKKKFVKEDVAEKLSEGELLDYLLLSGFSGSDSVTEISGRGVGLNIVQNMVNEVGGTLRITQVTGKGTQFYLRLPLTLSVLRALLVEVSDEPLAIPLGKIDRALHIPRKSLEIIEGRLYFHFEGKNIGLVSADEILLFEKSPQGPVLQVVVLSGRDHNYGLIVDRFIGQKQLVVHELNPRIGKIPNISAGALMEDGSPVLIVDTEELVHSIDTFLHATIKSS